MTLKEEIIVDFQSYSLFELKVPVFLMHTDKHTGCIIIIIGIVVII